MRVFLRLSLLVLAVLTFQTVLAFETTALRADDSAKSASRKNWVLIELKGAYREGAQLPGLFGATSETLAEAVARLDKAASDKRVHGVVLKINNPVMGWGTVNEFRQAVSRVRAQKKPVYAYLDMGMTTHYMLAAACDKIIMPESGMLMVMGLRAEVGFYKNLFDKLDIKADMLRVGKFKSAAEPYTRTEMSPEFRLEMEELLDDYYTHLVNAISSGRGLKTEEAEHAIDNGPLAATEAQKMNLIDYTAYQDQLKEILQGEDKNSNVKLITKYGKKKRDTDFSGIGGMVKMMNMMMGLDQGQSKSSSPKVAVIYAIGAIMPGESSSSFMGGDIMGSATMVKAIQKAAKDDTVKAIVLRVNSPGGSALASDLIWRALEKSGKPFVVSMGDVAGSGGYYIAMGADRIFAEPGTLTGSIGVVGGKIALDGFYNKIGLTSSVVSRGKNSGALSPLHPFNDTERSAMKKMMLATYEQFTKKAADGRGMDHGKLKELAGGRIYSGTRALKIGLVDEIGTLEDAIAYAEKMVGGEDSKKLERMVLPRAKSPFEAMFGPMETSVEAKQAQTAKLVQSLVDQLPAGMTQRLQLWEVIQLFTDESPKVLMPAMIHIR